MKGVLFLGVLLAVACTTRGDWMCTENLSCRDDETCLPNVAGTGYVCVNSSLDCGCDWAREWCRGVDSQSVTCVCQYGGSPGDCAYPPGPYCYGVYCAYGESCYSTSPSNEQYQCVNQTAAGRTCQECWSETSDCYANPGDNTDVHCGCKHSGSYPDCTGVPCGAGFCSAGQQCLPVKDAEDVMVCVNSTLVQENCFCYEFSACYAIYSGTSDPVPACACSIGGSYPECYTQVCGGSFCLSDEVCAQDVGGSSSADRCVNSTKYYEICNSCYNYGSSCGSYNGDKDDIRCICQYGGVSPNCSTPCGSGICSYDFICLGTEQWDSLCVSKTTVEEACHNCTADFSHCVAVAGQPNTAQCKCQYGGTYPSCLGTPCDGDHCTSEERCVQTKNQKSACVSLVEYNSCSNDCNFDGAGCFAVTTPTGPTTVSCQCQYSGTPGSCTGEKCGDVYCSIQESCFKNNNNEAPLCVDQNEISECQACYENGNSYCAAVAGNPNYVECRCYYGTYPNCVLPCGDANCTGSEHCIQQFQEDGEDYKMPLCVDEGNLNCNCESQLAECHAVPGTPNVAQCGCRFGGTYPNCLGQPCGNTHCGAMEYCFQNAVDNAQPVCVGYEHINCQPCNNWPSDSYCVGFVGTPDNFAQCKCIKPNPQNPSQCLPVACPRPGDEWPTMCNGTTKSCQNNPENDGKLECLCAPGLKMSRLTRECEERPILDPCVPCSSGVPRSQCGCAAGQTCEVPFVGAQGHCICAPGMVAYQDRDEGSVQCKPVAPPVSTAPATCIAGGDPHYMTFDKRFFDFQDRCDFVLVKSDNFEVHIRHGECASGTPNPTVSCTKAIAFLLPQDHVAEIAPGVATLIDNAPAPDFPFTAHGVEFKTFTYMEMEGIRVSFPDGAQIELFAYSVSVSLPPSSQYYGQVRGLCGDFNGNPVNDYTGRDEVVSSVAVVSARTWVVSNETDLVLFSEPNFGCADSYPVPADINELCPNNEYRDCGAMEKLPQDCWDYFDILKFYEICIYDNCQFNTSDAQFFVMPAWLRLCHRESLYRSLKCEPPCASDETCRINIETNSTTCIEKDVNVCPLCGDHQVCSITVSGDQQTGRCVCEEGFKPSQLDSSICVEEATCADVICDRVNEACLATDGANGQLQYTCQCIAGTVRNIISGACEFPANVTALGRCKTCQNGPDCGCSSPHQICAPEGRNSFYGTCVCEVGYSLNETSGLCQLIIIVPVPTPAVCQGYGDPHYTTFDNLYWHYQPKCDVYGVLGNGMNIQIRQGECWPQFGQNAFVSCVKAVAFTTPAPVHTIEFSDQHAAFYPNVDVLPSIWVDGVNQTSFPLTVSGVVITASANFQSMTATFPDGSSVSLSRYFSLSVVLPPVYMNNVTGICGNFNGDGTDGQDGDQYLVADGDELFRYANPDCYDKKRATTPTLRSGGSDSDPNCQVKAVQACAPLKAIQQTYPNCAQLVDMAPFIVSCVYDYCALGDAVPAMINASIDALKSRCEQKEQIYNNYLVSVTTGVVSTGEASTAGSGAVEMSTGNTNAQVTIVTLVVMLIVAFVL